MVLETLNFEDFLDLTPFHRIWKSSFLLIYARITNFLIYTSIHTDIDLKASAIQIASDESLLQGQ